MPDTGSGPIQTPLRKLGKYELMSKLAAGGMAEVYLARLRGPMNFQKAVVVKVIHAHLAAQEEFLRMLFDEARLSALIKHPRVVDIYELGQADDTYFIAMEYIDGHTLSAILRAGKAGHPLEPLGAARIIAAAADGLHAAHELTSGSGRELGLVHRDVSPGNIMVCHDGSAKIVDFGIAKARGRLTTSGLHQFKGKAGYVAPEQLHGGQVDRRTDVFSLGIVLWESLTLQRLFGPDRDKKALEGQVDPEPESPSDIRPEVPVEISAICLKALQQNPADRFQTAGEMKSALEKVLLQRGFYRESGHIQKYIARVFARQQESRQRAIRKLSAGFTMTGEMPALRGVDVSFDEEDFPDLEVSREGDDGDGDDELARGTPVAGSTAQRALPLRAEPEPEPERPNSNASDVGAVSAAPAAALVATPAAAEPAARKGSLTWLLLVVASLAAAAAAGVVVVKKQNAERVSALAAKPAPAEAEHTPSKRAQAAEPAATSEGRVDEAKDDSEPAEPAGDEAEELIEAGEAGEAVDEDDTGLADDNRAKASDGESEDDSAKKSESKSKESARRDQPRRSAAELYEEGAALFIKGKSNDAKQRFKQALSVDSRHAPAHRGLGLIYAAQGKKAKAANSFEQYLRLRPNAGDAESIRKRIEQLRK